MAVATTFFQHLIKFKVVKVSKHLPIALKARTTLEVSLKIKRRRVTNTGREINKYGRKYEGRKQEI
jgi:hypothetical protein